MKFNGHLAPNALDQVKDRNMEAGQLLNTSAANLLVSTSWIALTPMGTDGMEAQLKLEEQPIVETSQLVTAKNKQSPGKLELDFQI